MKEGYRPINVSSLARAGAYIKVSALGVATLSLPVLSCRCGSQLQDVYHLYDCIRSLQYC